MHLNFVDRVKKWVCRKIWSQQKVRPRLLHHMKGMKAWWLGRELPVKLSRDQLCSFRSQAKWRFDRSNYSALDFVFRPCLTISALEKIRFLRRYRPVTGLVENEFGKRRNEEKEGSNVGWSGETGKLQWWHNELCVSWLDALWFAFCACYRQLSNFIVAFRC